MTRGYLLTLGLNKHHVMPANRVKLGGKVPCLCLSLGWENRLMSPITRIKAGVGSDRIPCNGQYRGEIENASRFSLEGLQILLFLQRG